MKPNSTMKPDREVVLFQGQNCDEVIRYLQTFDSKKQTYEAQVEVKEFYMGVRQQAEEHIAVLYRYALKNEAW